MLGDRELLMTTELLYHQPVALIAIALLACMVIAAGSGYKLGRRGRQAQNELTRIQIGSIQAATLGLLALLLGFTFAMALSRFEYRKIVRKTAALFAETLCESAALHSTSQQLIM